MTKLLIEWLNFFKVLFSRLSNILALLTISQAWFVLAHYHGILKSKEGFPFDILHEDTIFIMHLMTWFIVRAIENLKRVNNEQKHQTTKSIDIKE